MKRVKLILVLLILQIFLPGCNNDIVDVMDKEKDNLLKRAFLLYSATLSQADLYDDPDDPQNNRWPVPNCSSLTANTYYVNFDPLVGASDDTNAGTSAGTAWKHCPGDPKATGVPAATTLQPGDVVLFRGGVIYRGSITMRSSGSADAPIFLEGSCWDSGSGKAILDGSEVLTGPWQDCNTTPDAVCSSLPPATAANVHYTDIPATYSYTPFTANLHENNLYLWMAQEPDLVAPYFWDQNDNYFSLAVSSMTGTSVTDSVNLPLNGNAAFWQNASVAVWTTGNVVEVRPITGYNTATHRITFSYIGQPGGRYSIINSLQALDSIGEYYIDLATHRVYLWPNNDANLAGGGITISTRNFGIDIAEHSYIRVEGFQIRKYSGDATSDGVGIGTVTSNHLVKSHITVRNNDISHNRHGTTPGYGLYLRKCNTSLVENNTVVENMKHRGIFVTDSSHAIVRNNTVSRSGGTSICFFSDNHSQITGNTVSDSNGSHANGISLYMACDKVLVAWNKITNSRNSLTYNNSGNLYFYRNFIDAGNTYDQCVSEWDYVASDPSLSGTISFLNNTIVRTNGHGAMYIGTWAQNQNIMMNNIVDGANGRPASHINRSYNIYTGLFWNQTSAYGWSLGIHETLVTDINTIFVNPAGGDFHLTGGSPAIHAGTNITTYLPVRLFPHVDFWKDLDGTVVPQDLFDLGAYVE